MNTFKTVILMALLTGLLIAAGQAFGGRSGAMIMLGASLVINFLSYWNSDKIVMKSYKAKEITRGQAPELYDLVAGLAKNAQLPMPKVCIIRSEVPNAFATGRNAEHAAVCVTTGIMRTLTIKEMSGVLAHELSHIKHNDTLISCVSASIAGMISTLGHLAQWAAIFGMGGARNRDENGGGLGLIFTIILAPLTAMLIQMAISRSREYEADKSGGEICGDPLALASALKKLDMYARTLRPLSGARPETAHLFIVNPLSGKDISFRTLFSTHPSTEDRVARLEAQAKEMAEKKIEKK